jgi:hypothetical protein
MDVDVLFRGSHEAGSSAAAAGDIGFVNDFGVSWWLGLMDGNFRCGEIR